MLDTPADRRDATKPMSNETADAQGGEKDVAEAKDAAPANAEIAGPKQPPNKLLEWALAIGIMLVLAGFLALMIAMVRRGIAM